MAHQIPMSLGTVATANLLSRAKGTPRRGAVERVDTCKFLLNSAPRGFDLVRALTPVASAFYAAEQHSIVNNNENTIAIQGVRLLGPTNRYGVRH